MGHSACRQQNGCVRDVSDHIRGADGHGVIFENRIDGANPYQHPGDKWELFSAMYRNEHKAMVAAIRAGQVIDNSHYMCGSTLMAVMGRMSAYTGKKVTWQEAWDSKEVLMPDAYVWGEAPESVVAVPGRYRLPVPPEPEVPDEQEAGTEGAGTTDASGGGAQGTGGAGTGGSGSGR